MRQNYYLLSILILYVLLILSYFGFNYLAYGSAGDDIFNLYHNREYINNILLIKDIVMGLLFFTLLGVVISRIRRLKKKLIWGILMFIPGINIIFTLVLAFE